MDLVLLRRNFDYGIFLEELYHAKVVEMSNDVVETAGLLFVKRKDDRLRLIWDTRRSNCHLTEPPSTWLASCDSLAEILIPTRGQLFAAAGDVVVCFYQYALPDLLRPHFGLQSIERRWSRVVPMGWNWAVHFIQRGHEFLPRDVAPEAEWLRDNAPPRPLQGRDFAKLLYIDNFAALGTSRSATPRPRRARPCSASSCGAKGARGDPAAISSGRSRVP